MRTPERLGRRLAQLAIGLYLFGLGTAMLVRSNLGPAPWDVLTLGIMQHIPLSFGAITVMTSVVVLLLWIPLKQRLGLGTVANGLLVGPFADLSFLFLPVTEILWIRIAMLVCGILAVGIGSGLYIGAQFGPGPRDGLMTGIHAATGWGIGVVRTSIEVSVVAIGWLLGGTVGFGTLAFALSIGPLVQIFLRRFTIPLRRK